VYFHNWYRDYGVTGGLFLQKATHDLDYIQYVLGGMRPVEVCAMKSKQVFKGDKPAGFMCENCPDTKTCPESPENVKKIGNGYAIGKYCCYSKDNTIEDSGSIIVEYDNGMHVSYTQDFITRHGAAKRGAYIVGYKGTIEFDFYGSQVKLHRHDENVTETHTFGRTSGGHFGGDNYLVRNFIGVMKGEETSKMTLKDGSRSLASFSLTAEQYSITEHFITC